MSEIILRKYHGVGNDYLIFDPKKNDVVLNERLIRQLCRRNIGVGADGILYGPVMEDKKIKVRIFNPDGSEAEKSGNGIRIFSRYLKDAGYVKERQYYLPTKSGLHQRLSAWLKTGNVGSASKKSIRWSSYMERHWKTLPLPAALGRKK